MSEQVNDKKQLRQNMIQLRNMLTAEQAEKDSQLIVSQYLNSFWYQNASALLCYVSYQREVCTYQLIQKALADGKKIAVPKVRTNQTYKTMEFILIRSLQQLAKGYQGIEEPLSGTVYIPDSRADMILPGLAFDIHGNRLGYGGGFYDRYLSEYESVKFHCTAFAYEFQILNKVVAQGHDKKVDAIITPNRIITFS